jgi:hypothetical protein
MIEGSLKVPPVYPREETATKIDERPVPPLTDALLGSFYRVLFPNDEGAAGLVQSVALARVARGLRLADASRDEFWSDAHHDTLVRVLEVARDVSVKATVRDALLDAPFLLAELAKAVDNFDWNSTREKATILAAIALAVASAATSDLLRLDEQKAAHEPANTGMLR